MSGVAEDHASSQGASPAPSAAAVARKGAFPCPHSARSLALVLMAAATLGVSTAAQAGPIAVQNASFELPALTTSFVYGPPSAWTLSGSGGVFRPTAFQVAPDGQQVAFLEGDGALWQQLAVAGQLGTTYHLSVFVGTQVDFSFGLEAYKLELFDGNDVIATVTANIPRASDLFDVSISGVGLGHGLLGVKIWSAFSQGPNGELLGVGQPLFDNVRVWSDEPQVTVAEPSTLALLMVAGLAGVVRRQRHRI